jgi:hypothetical protein
MRIVQMRKTLKWPVLNSLTPKQLLADINSTVSENFEFLIKELPYRNPRTMGFFYPQFIKDENITQKPTASLLELLKDPAVFPVLCTNGEIGHYCAYKLITQKQGVNILDLLQIKLLGAKKPNYFTANTSLIKFELASTYASIEELMTETSDKVFSQSSAKALLEYLVVEGEFIASKVHVGDNPSSDAGFLSDFTTIMIYRELLENEPVASLPNPEVLAATCYLEVWGSALEEEGRDVLGFAASKYRSAGVFASLDSAGCIEMIRTFIPNRSSSL